MPSLSAYGPNLNAGVNANADNGWGSYKWPGGVPSNLLGTAKYKGRNSSVSVICRKELVPLFELAFAIADLKHNYTIYGSPNPSGEPTWGPWGYENRPIGGTTSASNHSRGRAMDVNAPRNPQSYTFQSDMPVAMVRDFESIGFFWGGRYGGGTKYDAMHFEYCYSPADVPGHIQKATNILRGVEVNIPTSTPEPVVTDWWDEMSDAEKATLLADVADIKNKLGWLVSNEAIEGVQYSKTAANFNDTRDIPNRVLSSMVGDRTMAFILAWLAQNQGLQVFGVVPEQTLYGVVAGDQFNAIAKKFGITPDALAAANPQVTDRSALNVGQVLNIPKA